MIIPHQQISPDALQGILEEFMAREGTDYGAVEASLQEKISQLRLQLDRGEIVVALDPVSESVSLLPKRDAEQLVAHADQGDEWSY